MTKRSKNNLLSNGYSVMLVIVDKEEKGLKSSPWGGPLPEGVGEEGVGMAEVPQLKARLELAEVGARGGC